MSWKSFTEDLWARTFSRAGTPSNPLSLGDPEEPAAEPPPPEEPRWGDHQPISKIPFKILRGHGRAVSSCHFCAEDTRILSASYDRAVKVWDAATGLNIHNFEDSHTAPISECSLTADNKRVVTSSFDKTIKAWDMERGQVLWSFNHESIVLSCKISFDGKYVVCGLDVENAICVIDANNGKIITYVKDHHDSPVTTCCFNPDNLRVASGSSDRNVKIWDISAQTTLLTIHGAHSNVIGDCCFTFSGHFLCTASWDKTLKIWDVYAGGFRSKGACVTLMEGHEGSVSSCLFTRDASLIVSGAYDKMVTVWDVAGGYRKCTLKGHQDWVMDVAISNNRKWVISASKNPSNQVSQINNDKILLEVISGNGKERGELKTLHEALKPIPHLQPLQMDSTIRLWNIEKVDQIPMLIEYRKVHGLQIVECEKCERPFSLLQTDDEFEIVSKCVFCRLASPSRYALPIPPSIEEDEKDFLEKLKM